LIFVIKTNLFISIKLGLFKVLISVQIKL